MANFFNYDENYMPIDPRSSMNSKWDNHKGNQIAENQWWREHLKRN